MRLPLLALTLAACAGSAPDATIVPVEATFGGAPAACAPSHPAGVGDRAVALADARLFLSGFEVRDGDGAWVPAPAPDLGRWQHSGAVLLDFEDGSGACADSGNADTNREVALEIPDGAATGLRFTVGLPFETNHLASDTAPAPLNVPAMFWSWQGGYKFVRVDVTGDAAEGPARWNVHVGSTMCASDAPTQAPAAPCGRPNLATVTLDAFDPGTDALHIDLDALLAGADLGVNSPDTPPGCMSAPGEPADCDPVFAALGLDFETGACDGDCAGQAVFSGSPR